MTMFCLLPLLGGLLTLPSLVDQGSLVLNDTYSLGMHVKLYDRLDSEVKMLRLEKASENVGFWRMAELLAKEYKNIGTLAMLEDRIEKVTHNIRMAFLDLMYILYEIALKALAIYALKRKSRPASLFVLLSPVFRSNSFNKNTVLLDYFVIDNVHAFTTTIKMTTNDEVLRTVWFVALMIYNCILLITTINPERKTKNLRVPRIPTISSGKTTNAVAKSDKKKDETPSPIPQHLNSSKSKLLKICFEADAAKLKRYIKDCRYKININEVVNKGGNTVLHMVSENGLVEAAKVLIKQFDKKIDYDIKNKKSLTAFETAIANGQFEMVNFFARKNRMSKDHSKMMSLAEKSGNKELEQFLKSFVTIMDNKEQPLPTQIRVQALPYGPEVSSDSRSDSDDSDFRCTTCSKLMIGDLRIYGCTKEHLICNSCLDKTKNCPDCNESFENLAPVRRFTAEKLANLLFA